MQSDKTIETKNATLVWVSGGTDRAEYREALGYKMEPADKGVTYFDVSGKKLGMKEGQQNQPNPTEGDKENLSERELAEKVAKSVVKALGYPEKDLDESASFWETHPALDEVGQSLINAKPYVNGKVS